MEVEAERLGGRRPQLERWARGKRWALRQRRAWKVGAFFDQFSQSSQFFRARLAAKVVAFREDGRSRTSGRGFGSVTANHLGFAFAILSICKNRRRCSEAKTRLQLAAECRSERTDKGGERRHCTNWVWEMAALWFHLS